MIWSLSKEGPDFPTRAAQLVREGPTLPILIGGHREQIRTVGLIDTGASFCAVKPKLATRLGLKVVDRRRVSGVSPQGVSAEGFADVVFGFLGLESPPHSLPLQLVVVDFSRDHNELGLLLGRPFLQFFEFLYEGDCGRFKLTASNSSTIVQGED